MKKRMVLLGVVVALSLGILPYISAESISGEYFSGGNVTFMNITYILMGADPTNHYEQNYTKVIFKKSNPTEWIDVKLGKCYEKGFFEYCYDDQYYDWDTAYTYNNPYGRIEPKMRLKITYKSPQVSMERETSIKLFYDTSHVVNIKLKNTGTEDTIVDYYEYIPPEITVYNCDGCILEGKKVSKRVMLYKDSEVRFSYAIKKNDYNESTWDSFYAYEYNGGPFSGTSNVKLTIDKPYEITETLSSNTANDISRSFDYSFTLKNLENSVMNAKIIFNLKDFDVMIYDGWQKNGNLYIIERFIMSTSEASYKLRLKPKVLGINTIMQEYYLRQNNLDFNISKNSTFTVNSNAVYVSIFTDSAFYVPGETINSEIIIANPDRDNIYYNLFATLRGISEEYFNYPSIHTNQTIRIVRNYTAQHNTSINLSLLYRSVKGQEFKVSAEKPIIVRGAPTVDVPTTTIPTETTPTPPIETDTPTTSPPETTDTTPPPTETTPTETPKETINIQASGEEAAKKGSDWLSGLFDDINHLLEKIFGIWKKK